MKPVHALVIAGALALGVVLGVTALTKTSTLGASARHTTSASIAARAHKLDSFEASLKKALKAKPPALPSLPAPGAVAATVSAPAIAPAGTVAPRIVYQRPAPIVIHKHSHHGDDGGESEGGGSRTLASAGGSAGGDD